MARFSHLSICQKHIIHTTKYYLKKCTHFGESRYIASTQKLSNSILSDIYFCGVLNVAAFYFSLRPSENSVLVIYHLRGYFYRPLKCVLHVNKEVKGYDYEAYKSEEKERRKTNENQFKIQKSITKIKNKN